MGDIFLHRDLKQLLSGKFILILGDSNLRALYRDIIWLANYNSIIPPSHLRRKLDFSYVGDKLLKQGELNRGRDYVEMREYKKNGIHVKFNFLTKCYTVEIENMLNDFKRNKCSPPDIILINSCLWDITRWGPDGVNLYKENMQKLFRLFMSSLPSKTLVVFSTTLPVSSSCKGAFLVKQVEFMKHSLRFEVMEANLYAKQLVPSFGYNVLDFHYHFRMQIHRRVKDGVHWHPEAVRHMTNLFLTHLSLTWDLKLPGNFTSKALRRMESEAKAVKSCSIMVKMPQFNIFQDTSMPPPIAPVKKVRKLKSPLKNLKDTENIPPNKAAPCRPLSEPFRQRINGPTLPQPQIELFRKSLAEVKRDVGKANNMPKLMFIDPNSVAMSNRDAPGKMKRETKRYKNEQCSRPRLQPY